MRQIEDYGSPEDNLLVVSKSVLQTVNSALEIQPFLPQNTGFTLLNCLMNPIELLCQRLGTGAFSLFSKRLLLDKKAKTCQTEAPTRA